MAPVVALLPFSKDQLLLVDPEPQDLYLTATLRLDPAGGEILTDDEGDSRRQRRRKKADDR